MTTPMCGLECPKVGTDGDGREAECAGSCAPAADGMVFRITDPVPEIEAPVAYAQSRTTRFWKLILFAIMRLQSALDSAENYAIERYAAADTRDHWGDL